MRRAKKNRFSNFSIIEVFGGTFAFLVVLFVILNIVTETELQKRLEKTVEEGSYKISWENQSEGYIVIAFPSYLFIVEHQQKVELRDICSPQSNFIKYFRAIYNAQSNKQLIFAIVEDATKSMRAGRDCMRKIMPNKQLSIAWIIANQELLKSVSINQLPAYIKKAIQ